MMPMLTLTDLRGSTFTVQSVLPRAAQDITATIDAVTPILDQVRSDGVEAVLQLSERFDGVRPPSLRVPQEVMEQALEALDPTVRQALETLAARARDVHSAQLPPGSVVSPEPDARITNRWVPVDRVGP